MVKILFIDDEKHLRLNVSEILTLEGYDVITANDGLEGLAKAINTEPDLILCDLMMPNLDGYSVLSELKKTDLNEIPFIFLTAKSDHSDTRKGMELGADDYITKPFTREELVNSIKTRLDKRIKSKRLLKSKIEEDRLNLVNHFNGADIRTSLNIILGMSSVLYNSNDNNLGEDSNKMLTYIINSGWNIVRFMNNFYYNEILNKDEITPEFKSIQAYKAKSSIEVIAKKLTLEYARSKDLTLSIEDVEVPIDEQLFNYITEELLYNAFKFTQKGNPVLVKAYEKENLFFLEVNDFGVGFSATADQIQPFKKFSSKSDAPCSGLGLSNVKRITEKMGGTFKLDTKPNEGSSILISFNKFKK